MSDPAPVSSLRPVSSSDDLFPYPIAAETRLESHYFMTWHHRRWLTSDFRLLADLEVRAIGVDLFNIAHDQAPVGTLPVNPRLLAGLVGLTLDRWTDLAARPISPLYGWRKCLVDGSEVRLYHPVVLEMVQKSITRREVATESREADRERKRILALPDLMMRAGCRLSLTQDPGVVARFDQFLVDHFPGRHRRATLLRQIIESDVWQSIVVGS